MGNFVHQTNSKGGAFTYEVDDKKVAEMVYYNSTDKTIIIDHTDVDESLKGQGIGKKLLSQLVAYVRENQIKVIPFCTFAKATLEKTPEWQDIISPIQMKPKFPFGMLRDWLSNKN